MPRPFVSVTAMAGAVVAGLLYPRQGTAPAIRPPHDSGQTPGRPPAIAGAPGATCYAKVLHDASDARRSTATCLFHCRCL